MFNVYTPNTFMMIIITVECYEHLSATTEPSVDMCTDNHMMDFTCSHQSDSNRHIGRYCSLRVLPIKLW